MSVLSPQILVNWLIADFKKIILISLVFGVVSVFYALSIPNQYASRVVVTSNMQDAKSIGSMAKLGGLASLAGVSLGGSGELTPEVLYEMISSNSFLASFIEEYKLAPIIMAAESYDPLSNEYIYKKNIYDNTQKAWVREFKFPQKLKPSDIELVEKLKESLSASYARKTKLITISIKSYSPYFAKDLLEKLVTHFNLYVRKNDIDESESAIEYIKQELSASKFQEVKITLQQIMEEQYKKLALAKTRNEYAFRVIESPLLAAKKSEPKRAIICIVVTVGGTVLSILLWWTVRIFRTK